MAHAEKAKCSTVLCECTCRHVHVHVQVAIAGPAETLARRGPLEDGCYSFAYSTRTPGTYTISATAAGGHMEGSPATVTASIAEAHAPICEVVGTPLRISTTAGEPDPHAQDIWTPSKMHA